MLLLMVLHTVQFMNFQFRCSPDQNLAILCVFTCVHPPGAYHTYSCCPLHNIAPTSPPLPFRVHLIPCRYIVMPMSKRHTIKGTTRKVAPKPHSPPAAPDVAKNGHKPPRIREDTPWSPSKVVRQKLA
jgi:hypothetical protein